MKFYDVKNREHVDVPVAGKKPVDTRGGTRHMVWGETADGRRVTKFVSKEVYDETDV